MLREGKELMLSADLEPASQERTMMKSATRMAALAAGLALAGAPAAAWAQGEVNVYSAREPALLKPVLDAFTADTGIKVNIVFAQQGLEERIAAEGANSPADLLVTVDVSRLALARETGLTQPLGSPVVSAAVPPALRDAEGHWAAVTLRARVFYVSRERVKDTALTYEDLASPRWRGKVCARDGLNAYNTALFAHVVARLGAPRAEQWLAGVKANLAKKPSGGDRDVAKDIASGQCDIGIANTYYYGLMLNREADRKPWAEAVRVVMPTFEGGGTHVNVSGMAVLKHAPNRANAVRLAEWLVGDRAQALYARQNFEHPVRAGVELDATVQSFGPLNPDSTPLAAIAANRKAAADLVTKVGFNAGPGS
jgi:iron(III) transport system substrate-binding protein